MAKVTFSTGTVLAGAEARIQASVTKAIRIISTSNELEATLGLPAIEIEKAAEDLERAAALIVSTSQGILRAAGDRAAGFVAEALEGPMSFDATNRRAVEAMQRSRLAFILDFTQEQRDAARLVLERGIARGLNPLDLVEELRGSVGLTRLQVTAVDRYRGLLESGSSEALRRMLRDRRFDPLIQRVVRGGDPLNPIQIHRMVAAYRRRQVSWRTRMIARTEALRSVHQGTELLYAQAIEEGALVPESLLKTWHTARDEKVRGSHAAMSGQERRFGEPFLSGNGVELDHPGDPDAPASEVVNCRCAVSTVVSPETPVGGG